MTETDPGGSDRPPAEAGITGSRRKRVGAPITPDERESLNIPPKQPYGTPGEDLGVPESERDDTPRLPESAVAGATPYGKTVNTAGTGVGETKTGKIITKDENDAETVRRDIEDARRELGDTVEALVHKTDVKGRFQETAAHVGEDLRRAGAATATTATEMVERVKTAAPEMVGRVKETAPEIVGRVKEATPVEIKDAAEKVATEAGKRPVLTVAAVAAFALLVFRVLRRGKRR
ncbi:DUF3618 domain-containing protein [Streptosporangium sp. NBC_01755]|uniref:DUF3618 domain-containing protein n=1 Tax=unclassified Streptosporangium TaxID=2632669 RepID=UPI002DDA950C|nr:MULTISPECIES: DUF3618 domain-containing protein [unclassified Streptosporangium]WSA27832.1 DUF3618 domain-containing protein [Streptosporangium sp. NBC_01810]WSD00694.1 DUF3618 domain-containing protein [Streptosporangium sp. NBC_01755]